MRGHYVLLSIAVCFFLAGCLPSMKEQMAQKGFDPSYSQGYEDGVASGKNVAGSLAYQLRKDTRRFATDEQYRQGWNDGYDAGKNKEQNWQRTLENAVKNNN